MRWPRWYAVRRMQHWQGEVAEYRAELRWVITMEMSEATVHDTERLLTLAMDKAETWRRRTYR